MSGRRSIVSAGQGTLDRISRFISIGALATITHVTVATLCARTLPITAQQANFIGFCCAISLSYFGHARVTFQVGVDYRTQLPRFLVAALAGLGVSSGVTWISYDRLGAPFWLSMVLTAICVPAFSYMLLRLWVFMPGQRGGDQ